MFSSVTSMHVTSTLYVTSMHQRYHVLNLTCSEIKFIYCHEQHEVLSELEVEFHAQHQGFACGIAKKKPLDDQIIACFLTW